MDMLENGVVEPIPMEVTDQGNVAFEPIPAENGGRILSDNPDDENNDARDSVNISNLEVEDASEPEFEPEIMTRALTKDDLKDMNFVELQRMIRVTQRNIDALEDAKVMVDSMVNLYHNTKDIFDMANEYKKGHEITEEGEVDYSDLVRLPKEFQANYDANKPILEENLKVIDEFAKEKYGTTTKTTSFFSNQLLEALQHQLDRIQNNPDENKKFTIPKEILTEKEKNAVRSLNNSIQAVLDRPSMNYIVSHCTTTGALINTWNQVKKDYTAADKLIRKYCMETMQFNINEFNAVVKYFMLYAGSAFIARMMLYQFARIIKNGKHDGTDMYGRLFLLNVSDYTYKRFDYDDSRLDAVMKTISMAYNEHAVTTKGISTVKAYRKLPIAKTDLQMDLEMTSQFAKAVKEVESQRSADSANNNGRGMTASIMYFADDSKEN